MAAFSTSVYNDYKETVIIKIIRTSQSDYLNSFLCPPFRTKIRVKPRVYEWMVGG